jgi:hypothetical protein
MEAMAIIAIVNAVLAAAFKLWEMADQIKGNQKIPTWEELIDKNKLLQDKIDAELK